MNGNSIGYDLYDDDLICDHHYEDCIVVCDLNNSNIPRLYDTKLKLYHNLHAFPREPSVFTVANGYLHSFNYYNNDFIHQLYPSTRIAWEKIDFPNRVHKGTASFGKTLLLNFSSSIEV